MQSFEHSVSRLRFVDRSMAYLRDIEPDRRIDLYCQNADNSRKDAYDAEGKRSFLRMDTEIIPSQGEYCPSRKVLQQDISGRKAVQEKQEKGSMVISLLSGLHSIKKKGMAGQLRIEYPDTIRHVMAWRRWYKDIGLETLGSGGRPKDRWSCGVWKLLPLS